MNRRAQHLRLGDTPPWGLARLRNTSVNRGACGAMADGFARELVQVPERCSRHTNPAESLRKTNELDDAICEAAMGLVLTAIMEGACGSGG